MFVGLKVVQPATRQWLGTRVCSDVAEPKAKAKSALGSFSAKIEKQKIRSISGGEFLRWFVGQFF